MLKSGLRNEAFDLEAMGFEDQAHVFYNLGETELTCMSVAAGEACLSSHGALVAMTGQHTGRSPNDKFVVKDELTCGTIWWDNNRSLSSAQFDRLHNDMLAHVTGKNLFVQDLIGGADPAHALQTRVITELAWQSLFIRNLLIRPEAGALKDFATQLTIIDLPSFKADPARHGTRSETVIAIDLTRMVVLIAGTAYAGEIKKSVFTILNFLLPARDVMPMHCSANVGAKGDAAIFFGLSGTGKTTLSADPDRTLIGDDEHGWSQDGIFNFEGGCYAKTIRLSAEAEPEIFDATRRKGTVLENVILDKNLTPDFDNASLTENSRCAYPLHFISNASTSGRAGHPKNIVMLTADAFGILPPIAKLTPGQAVYHFLSGYTAKVAGTERGVGEPEATFSTCFGAPFMPRRPSEYGALLRKLIADHNVDCWLVNTGWTGGAHGVGSRMPIKATRTMLSAALSGALDKTAFRRDPNFGFLVPTEIDGINPALLEPRSTWSDPLAYDAMAKRLVSMFSSNFEKFEDSVDALVLEAAPQIRLAAE